MKDEVYPYKQKLWLGPLVSAFFGPCAYFFMYRAQHGDRGLIINRLIELTPQQATYFHWTLFLASVVFVLLGLFVFVLSFRNPRRITLSATALIAPKAAFSAKYIEIPYRDIVAVQVQEVQGQRFLHIRHSLGKLSLIQAMLPSKNAFNELSQQLAARVDGA